MPLPHPEVLSPEYVPPVLVGRSAELVQLARWLAPGSAFAALPPVAAVAGPAGSGTSAVARVAARRQLEALRREQPPAPPLIATVRVRTCRGAQGVAAGLLQALDEEFRPRGFHTAEILAGFVRRLRREQRSAVVVLDDVGLAAPDLSLVFRAFTQTGRFLPEGVDDAPGLSLIVAGRSEAVALWGHAATAGVPVDRVLRLGAYGERELRAIASDRVGRALGRPAPEGMVARVAARAARDPSGATRLIGLVRRELLGREVVVAPAQPRGAGSPALLIEPHFVDAIVRATAGTTAELGEIRSWEARLARTDGRRPLPATTMWRRILRLEAEGLVRRSIRPGGDGGTRSTLELLRPVSEWPVPRARPGTLPASSLPVTIEPAPSWPMLPAP
jgi:hypothetical protein